MKRRNFVLAFILCAFAFNIKAWSKTISMQELKNLSSNKACVSATTGYLEKDHWAYKTLEDITKKYNLLSGKNGEKYDGSKSLTRNEAALLLVNLVGQIQQSNVQISEADKARMDILRQEFGKEINELMARVATVETSVDSLKARVSNVEEQQNRGWKSDFGENMKINGRLQAQYTANFKKGDDQYPSNFSIPYSELKISGKLAPHVDYRALLVPSRLFDNTNIQTKNTRNMLDDMYISTDIVPHHTIYAGQTRLPIGYEGPMNPYDIETVDKAQIARNFSDNLDIGIKAKGNFDWLEYTVGAYNGNGAGQSDSNSNLDLASWAVIKPLYKLPKLGNLEMGGGYTVGKTSMYSHNTTSFYSSYKFKKLNICGEYAFKDGYLAQANSKLPNGWESTKARGWYVHSSYYLTDKLQLLGRLDKFDPNSKISKNTNTEYTLGGNYYLKDNVSIMTGYVFVSNPAAAKNSNRLEALTQVLF